MVFSLLFYIIQINLIQPRLLMQMRAPAPLLIASLQIYAREIRQSHGRVVKVMVNMVRLMVQISVQ